MAQKQLKDYITICIREAQARPASKTIICRLVCPHFGIYWAYILSQITLNNDLNKNVLTVIQDLLKKITCDGARDEESRIKSLIDKKVKFILNSLNHSKSINVTLSDHYSTAVDREAKLAEWETKKTELRSRLGINIQGQIEIFCGEGYCPCSASIADAQGQLLIKGPDSTPYNLDHFFELLGSIIDFITVIFEITSRMGSAEYEDQLIHRKKFSISKFLVKIIKWQVTPCIADIYYVFFTYFKKYGITIKMMTPDCEGEVEEKTKQRRVKPGGCHYDLTSLSEKIAPKDLLAGGGDECSNVNIACKAYIRDLRPDREAQDAGLRAENKGWLVVQRENDE